MERTTTLILLLTLALPLATSCGPDTRRPTTSSQRPQGGGGEGDESAFGSETDPSRSETFGEMTVTRDTYVLPRQTDRHNFARAKLYPSPEQADLDTFEVRVKEGRYIPISAGTKVVRRYTRNFEQYTFIYVEVPSIKDENGYPVHGAIYEEYLKD